MQYSCTVTEDALETFICNGGNKMSNEVNTQKLPELIKHLTLIAMQANYQCFVEKEQGYSYAILNYKHVLSQLSGIWIRDPEFNDSINEL